MADNLIVTGQAGVSYTLRAKDLGSSILASAHTIVDTAGNFMPAGDTQAHAIQVQVGNGTQTLPSADAAARKLFAAITDGTNTATVKAASTLAATTDTSLVVQPLQASDGTHVTPIGDAAARAIFSQLSDASTGPVLVSTTRPASNAKGLAVRSLAMTDGTNDMPTLDAKARRGWMQPSDGTNDFLSGSAANLAAESGVNAQLSAPPGQWAVQSSPAAGTLGSASKSAGGAGVRHICTGISFAWASDGTANGAAQSVTVVIRDGATGAGTILGQWTLARTTTTAADAANAGQFSLTGLNLVGTAATAMTAEFTGTASNHELYTANLFGYDAV